MSVASLRGSLAHAVAAPQEVDLVIVGAGTAGLPAAIFASRRGLRVGLIEAADDIGGTLHLANGQVSAAGSRTQLAKGIADSPDRHFDDCMMLSRGKADRKIIRRAVDEAPATINWLLDAGLIPLPNHPVTGDSPGRPAYRTERYLWAKEEGRAILAVIRREFEQEQQEGRISLWLGTRVTALLSDESGVTGVRMTTGSGERLIFGRSVLLTTGGYAMNPTMFAKLSGTPAYTGTSWPQALGEGLTLAESVGGYLRGQTLHRTGTGSILTDDVFPAKVYARVDTTPQRRLPWEIWVNDQGRRFIREDEPSTYERERILAAQTAARYRIVFDEQILRDAPPMIAGWSLEKLRGHFGTHKMFTRSDTLDGLASLCGIDPATLRDTVARYNTAVEGGGEDEFGRGHRPRRIATAPFYAITHLGHSATSSAGVVVDGQLRVLRKDGSVVRNLYAAGEVLGSGVTLGDAFVPGMMLTPALALGRWLGNTLPSS